jgi:hypothetical protein
MKVTPSGIVTEVKLEQPENAPSPIEVTPSGMLIACSDAHPAKKFSAIVSLSPVKVTRSNVAYALGKSVDNGVDVLQETVTSLILEHPSKVPKLNATHPQSLPDAV